MWKLISPDMPTCTLFAFYQTKTLLQAINLLDIPHYYFMQLLSFTSCIFLVTSQCAALYRDHKDLRINTYKEGSCRIASLFEI